MEHVVGHADADHLVADLEPPRTLRRLIECRILGVEPLDEQVAGVAVRGGQAPGDLAVVPQDQERQAGGGGPRQRAVRRSEEHTSELQSPMTTTYDVLCLKKK